MHGQAAGVSGLACLSGWNSDHCGWHPSLARFHSRLDESGATESFQTNDEPETVLPSRTHSVTELMTESLINCVICGGIGLTKA